MNTARLIVGKGIAFAGSILVLLVEVVSSFHLALTWDFLWVFLSWVFMLPLLLLPFLAGYGVPFLVALVIVALGMAIEPNESTIT